MRGIPVFRLQRVPRGGALCIFRRRGAPFHRRFSSVLPVVGVTVQHDGDELMLRGPSTRFGRNHRRGKDRGALSLPPLRSNPTLVRHRPLSRLHFLRVLLSRLTPPRLLRVISSIVIGILKKNRRGPRNPRKLPFNQAVLVLK